MGGNNDTENLVELTAREHFICHKLLTEIIPTESKLHYAAWLMATMKNSMGREYRVSAREYQRLKENLIVTDETRRKVSEAGKGRIVSDITKDKLRKIHKGKPKSEEHKRNLGGTKSVEHKKKLSESHTGKVLSEYHKRKISEGNQIQSEERRQRHKEGNTGENNGMFGKRHSLETKLKMSKDRKGSIPWNKGKRYKLK